MVMPGLLMNYTQLVAYDKSHWLVGPGWGFLVTLLPLARNIFAQQSLFNFLCCLGSGLLPSIVCICLAWPVFLL